jgi:hypothetical protein
MQRALPSAILLAMSACHQPTPLADGCYRFMDGKPLFRLSGTSATVIPKSAMPHFTLITGRDWHGDYAEVDPGFYLDDGSSQPEGTPIPNLPRQPERFRFAGDTHATALLVRFAGDTHATALLVPVIASGEARVVRGAGC